MAGTSLPQSAPRRILQIGYYENLIRTRAAMLQRSGFTVSSVLGNDGVQRAAASLIPESDLIMVGFSGRYAERIAITHWLKQHYPQLPVVVLQTATSERFPEADLALRSDDPEGWVDAIRECLLRRTG